MAARPVSRVFLGDNKGSLMIRWCAAVLFLLWAPNAWAQESLPSASGVITGSVLDAQHHAVAAAKVILERTGAPDVITAQTDSNGMYRMSLPAGTYSVRVEGKGGKSAAGPVTLSPSKVATLDLILQPSASADLPFFDEPTFTVAGVKDNTYRGGHGSDAVLRSAEALTQETASLAKATPAGDDPNRALAERNERAGHPLEAAREFQRAAELNPSEPNLYDWGTELLTHRAPEAAAEVFSKGVRLFPQSVRMMLGLATAWYTAGSYDKAGMWFYKATDLDPGDPAPYLFLGKVQAREIAESPEYQQRMARFVQLHPESALAHYYNAVTVWSRSGGPEDLEASRKARALLEKAIALDPRLALAYLQLGIVNATEQKYSDAIREYRKAIELSPALEEAHYRLSAAYRLTGEQAKAEEELAIYNRQSKLSAEALERERSEIQQFIVNLKDHGRTQSKPPR